MQEGTRAMFRGLAPTIYGVAPSRAIYFSSYSFVKSSLAPQYGAGSVVNMSSAIAAGSFLRCVFVCLCVCVSMCLCGRSVDQCSPSVFFCLFFLIVLSVGVFTATITNPIWVIKTRLQLQTARISSAAGVTGASTGAHGGSIPYRGTVDCLQRIIREEGPRALYRGLSASYVGTRAQSYIRLLCSCPVRAVLSLVRLITNLFSF